VQRALALGLTLLAAAATGCSVPGVGQVGRWSFDDTLPKMIDRVGDDARVIHILDRDGNVTYVVLGSDGNVHERYYEYSCHDSAGGPGTSCSPSERGKDRAPLRGETELASVRLGDLDRNVVDDLRDETDAFGGAPVGLRGRRWVVAAGVFKAYVAKVDGSDVHRAESAADRAFANSVSAGAGARKPGSGGGGSATGPPPDLPAPPGQYAQGRPDFDAFAEALIALRGRIGRNGRLSLANVADGVVSFEYVTSRNLLVRVRWDPGTRKLVDAGQAFGDGTEPLFRVKELSAVAAERMARAAATRERAEVAPGIVFKVAGGETTATMIVNGPGKASTYTARADGSRLTKLN
jgi:hypothetical protein